MRTNLELLWSHFAGLIRSFLLMILLAAMHGDLSMLGGNAKPNIVFFLVDDLGWNDLKCYGSPFYDTPNVDRLAREGVHFTDAYATCHVCSPSRASILTGKYPARLQLTDWLPGRREFPFQKLSNAAIKQALPLEEITLAETLKENGYRTGHFGKWHLGEEPYGPLAQGFDVRVPTDWNKGWPRSGYHSPFNMTGLEDEDGAYLTDVLTDEALKFIESSEEQPFFLYLSHFAVHDPIQGPSDLVEKYETKRSRLPADPEPFILEGNPDAELAFERSHLDQFMLQEPYKSQYRVLPDQTVKIKQRQDNPQFAAMVESMDESLGRVMAKLEELGLTDDTILFFTSDNGGMAAANFGRPNRVVSPDRLDGAYATSNHPLRGAKGWLYEGGIRVPLIIKWPGHVPFTEYKCHEPVIGVDFYPTILDMLDLSKNGNHFLDGISLVPYLAGKTTVDRDALYWHFPHYSNHGMQSPGGAIRKGAFKLLEYFENGSVQLFDLHNDPGEQNDLATQRPDVVKRLLSQLRDWRNETNVRMMPVNPNYDPSARISESR